MRAIIMGLALISDGHRTGDRADCLDHVEMVRAERAAVAPGLVVMAGDRALEGVAGEADLVSPAIGTRDGEIRGSASPAT